MKLKTMIAPLALTLAVTACSSSSKNSNQTAHNPHTTSQVAEVQKINDDIANQPYYAVLEFDKGTQRLNPSSKSNLQAFVASAQKEGRAIDDIRILAWADNEYPETGVKISDRDVRMANERMKAIEKYLKDDLKTDGDYATYRS